MKKILDAKYVKIAIYTLFVIVASILTYRISSNTDNIVPNLFNFFKSSLSIFSPIFYGLLIAYLMNPAVAFFERHLVRYTHPTTTTQNKRLRVLSIVIVYLCLFGTIFLTIRFLVPQILENIKVLITNLPTYVDEFQNMLFKLQTAINERLASPDLSQFVNEVINPTQVRELINPKALQTIFDKLVASTMTITGTLLNLVIGFVISVYAIMQKETFINGSKRTLYAIFKVSTAQKIIDVVVEAHTAIINFFIGKSLDSLIIGIICFIGLSILKNPYALLLSFIVGVFNMIPYFGPFIGAIPAVVLTLFEGVGPAIIVGIFIFFLQQFDGLILGPKILGESIGITPFWIISAITIGGALAGPLGMFFASPILAVILAMINRWIDKRLEHKQIELPKLSYTDTLEESSSK